MSTYPETVLEGRDGKRVVIGFEHPFVMIGERINPTNRKTLTEQLMSGDMAMVQEDARQQVEAGAGVIDVNVGYASADEAEVMPIAVRAVMEVVDVPICFDTPNVAAIEAGLKVFKEMGGKKALINSVTAEKERMDATFPIAAEYGAALVGLVHDESGISHNVDERLEAAALIIEQAATHGIPKEDLLIDPLTLTSGANTQSGIVALETQRRVWEELGANTTTGASNVAFGLPDRPSINTAYLPLMISRGLTSAITNPLEEYIQKVILASDVLMGRDESAMAWIQSFRSFQEAEKEKEVA